jgi:hypothetical protein
MRRSSAAAQKLTAAAKINAPSIPAERLGLCVAAEVFLIGRLERPVERRKRDDRRNEVDE